MANLVVKGVEAYNLLVKKKKTPQKPRLCCFLQCRLVV